MILTIANLPGDDFIDSDGTPHYDFTIADVTNLPTGEYGTGDDVAIVGDWPDNQYDASIDFGFIPEPEYGSSLAIKGVDFATSGTCGHFDVRPSLRRA